MAIKYGRPIDAKSRLAPVEAEAPARKAPLDLAVRPRRNRKADWKRRLVRENVLTVDDLIWPLFLVDGTRTRAPVASMPGVERLSVDEAVRDAERAAKLDISCIALFPYTDPNRRDHEGTEALNPDNLVCRAIRAIKREVPQLGVLCDVALDPYTSHGHDGLLHDGVILNDETVAVLVQQALVEAEAGADIIAPSDMMDGRVGASDRRQAHLPDGSGELRRGAARGRARHPRRRRHGHGQAGHALSRRAPPREGYVWHADPGLPGLRRVRDDHGGGAERLARW